MDEFTFGHDHATQADDEWSLLDRENRLEPWSLLQEVTIFVVAFSNAV